MQQQVFDLRIGVQKDIPGIWRVTAGVFPLSCRKRVAISIAVVRPVNGISGTYTNLGRVLAVADTFFTRSAVCKLDAGVAIAFRDQE